MSKISHDRTIDYSRLGPHLIQAAATILAIRTARREAIRPDAHESAVETEREIDFALLLAARLVTAATVRHANYFRQKVEQFTTGVVDGDIPL